jgi:hypothetical protein
MPSLVSLMEKREVRKNSAPVYQSVRVNLCTKYIGLILILLLLQFQKFGHCYGIPCRTMSENFIYTSGHHTVFLCCAGTGNLDGFLLKTLPLETMSSCIVMTPHVLF